MNIGLETTMLHEFRAKAASVALLALLLTACAAPPAMAPPAIAPAGTGGEVPRITPVPDGYACGDQIFKVAFEEGVAYVTLPNGTMMALPRQRPPGGADPEAPRLFSNGRMAFTQEIEGGRAVRVRHAMGRAAFQECKRLP
jgi:hypothetical protein